MKVIHTNANHWALYDEVKIPAGSHQLGQYQKWTFYRNGLYVFVTALGYMYSKKLPHMSIEEIYQDFINEGDNP